MGHLWLHAVYCTNMGVSKSCDLWGPSGRYHRLTQLIVPKTYTLNSSFSVSFHIASPVNIYHRPLTCHTYYLLCATSPASVHVRPSNPTRYNTSFSQIHQPAQMANLLNLMSHSLIEVSFSAPQFMPCKNLIFNPINSSTHVPNNSMNNSPVSHGQCFFPILLRITQLHCICIKTTATYRPLFFEHKIFCFHKQ